MKRTKAFLICTAFSLLGGCSSTSGDNRPVKNLDDVKMAVDAGLKFEPKKTSAMTFVQPSNKQTPCKIEISDYKGQEIEWYGECSSGLAKGLGLLYFPENNSASVSEFDGGNDVQYSFMDNQGNYMYGEVRNKGESSFRSLEVKDYPGEGKSYTQNVAVLNDQVAQYFSQSPVTKTSWYTYGDRSGKVFLHRLINNDDTWAVKAVDTISIDGIKRSIVHYFNGNVAYNDSLGALNMRPSSDLIAYFDSKFSVLALSDTNQQVGISTSNAIIKIAEIQKRYCSNNHQAAAFKNLCDSNYNTKNQADFNRYAAVVQRAREQRREQIQLAAQQRAIINQQQAIIRQQQMASLNQSLTNLNNSLQQQTQNTINTSNSYVAPQVQPIQSPSPVIDHYRCQQLGSQTFCKQL
ncbi:hypothetical protein ACLBW2_06270 [Enterobacteriaceae bacterium C23F]